MNKQEALIILVKNSGILTEVDKDKLLAAIPNLAEEEIDNLGRFLALEKKNALEINEQLIGQYEEFIKKIDQQLAKEA